MSDRPPLRKFSSPLLAPLGDSSGSPSPRRKHSYAPSPTTQGDAAGSGGRERTRWKFPFFQKSRRDDRASAASAAHETLSDPEFLPVCPLLALTLPDADADADDDDDPRQSETRRDMSEFFEQRRAGAELSADAKRDSYSWQSPSSWASMHRDTFAANAAPRKSSLEPPAALEQVWALRIFKPVEALDGVVSKMIASSGYTYVTVSCGEETTAAELCLLLLRKFTSPRDLTRFRLYVLHRGTERLLHHHDEPVKMLKAYLVTMGYTDGDQLNKIFREDHSYCCRFIFREYPPAPPRSEDFLSLGGGQPAGGKSGRERAAPSALAKARITAKSAYLAGVNLSVVPTLMFLNARTLQFVDLSRNTLLTLPDDLFEMLTSLRLLRLIGNLLTAVPLAVTVAPNITHLDLSSNCLDGGCLAVLASMSRLTHLNVSCNCIRTLPDEIAHIRTLRSFDLSSNYLEELPACIWSITELRELNAAFNRITAVPKEITSLRMLRTLILVGNSIRSLNPNIKDLPHLRQLDVRGNLLDTVEGLDSIASLFELSIDYNSLTSITSPRWPLLASLSAANNSLTTFEVCETLSSLRRLDLSSSKIASLPDDIFARMAELEVLLLQENELTKLPGSVNLLGKLRKLTAHSNSISEISLAFSALPHLAHLELHTNNIKSITLDIWNAPSLKVLNISSNFLASFPSPPPLDTAPQPPPLAACLEEFMAADNRLSDEIADVVVLFRHFRVLNLSYNRIFDLGDSLRHMDKLAELYLSGNGLKAFPEEIGECHTLRMLFINSNKLSNLPAELGKNQQLVVFDVQSNYLKYNISNWPYDWNWNFNSGLQYLNLANNNKLEIRASFESSATSPLERTLTDFKSMQKLRLLDLTNVQVSPGCLPEGFINLQTRLGQEQTGLNVSVAEYCGREINFDHAEFVTRHFMGQEKDHLVGLFDGGGKDFVSTYLKDTLEDNLKVELRRLRQGEDFFTAIRRAFLATNRDLSMQPVLMHHGSTACLLYLLENQLLVANVGDTVAVLSREGTAHVLTTKHHPWSRTEQSRIRDLGGFISLEGLVERELYITRAFGYHHLLPYVNANPTVNEIFLCPTDEFVLVATQSFWKVMSYQMAVDVARKERDEPDVAVQKLRDMAIARGVIESMKIMFVDFRGITTQSVTGTAVTERRRNAFRRHDFDDQVLSRLDDEIPPPKPPCAFVFTDIKNFTKLWSMLPNAMRVAIKQHNNIVRRLMRIHGGYEVKTEGDSFVIAFQSGMNALRFCVAAQQQFLENDWPREILDSPLSASVSDGEGQLLYRGLSIRMGIHYGMADDEEDKVAKRMDYHGIHMIIAARVSALADGGEINITEAVYNMYLQLPETDRLDISIYELGLTHLKGFQNPECLYVVYPKKLCGRYRMRSDSIKSNSSAGEAQLALQLASATISSSSVPEAREPPDYRGKRSPPPPSHPSPHLKSQP